MTIMVASGIRLCPFQVGLGPARVERGIALAHIPLGPSPAHVLRICALNVVLCPRDSRSLDLDAHRL